MTVTSQGAAGSTAVSTLTVHDGSTRKFLPLRTLDQYSDIVRIILETLATTVYTAVDAQSQGGSIATTSGAGISTQTITFTTGGSTQTITFTGSAASASTITVHDASTITRKIYSI